MDKKFWLHTVIMFVVTMALGFVVHGWLLRADYSQLSNLFRVEPDASAYCKYMFLAHLLMSGALVWVYRCGKQLKPFLGQGIRFGLAMICLMTIPMYLIYFAVQPMPGMLVTKQIIFDSIGTMGASVLLAWLER